MNVLYQELVARIRGEVSDLERVVERALQAWDHTQEPSEAQQAYLDSVALNLHALYSGIERLFELIARHVDRSLPTSTTWHHDLLQQMAQDRPDVRPPVISHDTVRPLDEFRRFRHLVRNVYAIDLVPERMTGLMAALPELWPNLRAEMLAFADFLEELAQVG